jgi:conjugative relaxase-like TrwC/TraI family protein
VRLPLGVSVDFLCASCDDGGVCGSVLVPVLSLWKLRVGAENYYLARVASGLDDYYTGRGETPGRWLGAAATGLDLSGEVTVDELRAVLAGLRPGTGMSPNGERLRTWKNRVPGFDLTFSAPKSVSVLYALGDPLVRGHVVEATDAAVEEALAWLEREACFVRRGSNNRTAVTGTSEEFGTRRFPGAGFVAARFRHRSSRAGDPQLHTHVLVANLTRGRDGRWSALDAQALYRSKRTAGVVYQTVLRQQLTRRLGVEWGPIRNDTADVAGIPASVVRLFSKRRSEIEAELARTGSQGPAAAAEATLSTRRGRAEVDEESLYQRWQDEAATVGFGPDDIDRLLAHRVGLAAADTITVQAEANNGTTVERDMRCSEFAGTVADLLINHDSTFAHHDVITAVASLLPAGTTVAALERITHWVLSQPQLVPIPSPTGTPKPSAGFEQRWTSRRLIGLETELVAAFTATDLVGHIDSDLVETILKSSPVLGGDQADAVRRVTTQGRPVEVIVGRAGSGKTFTIDTVRQVFHGVGYELVGVAPSARAARELADGAGIETWTVPRFMRFAAPDLTPRTVVVVDEAGMVGTVDLHEVVTAARRAGAKVILVGDHHQLPEVNAGGGFAAAITATGNHLTELTVNRRQVAEWEVAALDELRHGHVAAAFDAYQHHRRVVLADTPADVRTAAIEAWVTSHLTGHNGILLAGTRAEAKALNRAARSLLAGRLTGPILEVRGRQFQAGDRIVLLHNDGGHLDLDRGTICRVDNGMIATITRIDSAADSVDIRLVNGRRIRLGRDYVLDGCFDHGYATTVHKAQGLTCDEVFVVGPAGLYREAVYVAMSRARYGAWIFATRRHAAELTEQPHTTGIPLPSEHTDELELDLRTALVTSRAKTLAITQYRHLVAIADLAATIPLDQLWRRHVEIRRAINRLAAAGHTNPTIAAARLDRARNHRRFLRPAGRVNAADWNNVGTITAVFDTTGTALVTFTSSNGRRHATRTLDWADLAPIDDPDLVEISEEAANYFALAEHALAEAAGEWNQQLAIAGIDPDEPDIVPAAIEQRRHLVAHQLAAEPPIWLTWWLGQRPTDPTGAQVYDDEVAHLAGWRDARHLDPNTPGYGPPPDDPHQLQRWRQHLDRSLTTRTWLATHYANVPPEPVPAVDIAAVRQRLTELDALLATAPADQSRIIAAIQTGQLSPPDVHQALLDAATTQSQRRDWILQHWPHVVEHAALTRIHHQHDPLAHWPTPPTPQLQHLLRELRAASSDTPETRTLNQLDTEVAAANPEIHVAKLNEQLDAIATQIRELAAERLDANHAERQLVDHHLQRIAERQAELAARIRDHDGELNLWALGSRPPDLIDAIERRANHLAHTAITAGDPWILDTIQIWLDHSAEDHDTTADLHHLIRDIASHRERAHHRGADPIGPEPEQTAPRQQWQLLKSRLHGNTRILRR